MLKFDGEIMNKKECQSACYELEPTISPFQAEVLRLKFWLFTTDALGEWQLP